MRRKFFLKSSLGFVIFLTLLITTGACWAGEKVFPGGTLDDLRQLSPTLSFDHLRITGTLSLPAGGAASLNVNKLTITESGGVGYTYSDCTYMPAPDFTVRATGDVVINGDITLSGRYGTRTLSGSSCNQCGGESGGDIRITADAITITGQIRNRGGSGSTSVSDGCSSGCEGGDAGGIFLTARNITFIGADLQTRGGTGGTGHCYGNENHGSNGDPGSVGLMATGLFQMNQSSVFTDGTLTLQASSTDIYGPIHYGYLNENIGGQTDELDPEVVEILSPLSGSTVSINEPLEIRIQLQDSLTGVKEVQVTGLGHNALHSGIEIKNRILSITISKPTNPSSLHVIAWDNKGNSTHSWVTGLRMEGNLTIAGSEIYNISGDLDLGSNASINILGTLVIKRGTNPTITAGSLTIAETGKIEIEAPVDRVEEKAPSLSFFLSGTAEINGIIDVSGHNGLPNANYQKGEIGGDFAMNASSILISGSILSNGGDGRTREYGWPAQTIGAPGSKGGTISLSSLRNTNIGGTLSVNGGNSRNTGLGGCFNGTDGGNISISYGSIATVSGAVFHYNPGTASSTFSCSPEDGTFGSVKGEYWGPPNPTRFVEINEFEPNNSRAEAQHIQDSSPVQLFPPVRIRGIVSPLDVGDMGYDDDNGQQIDDLEDVYVTWIPEPMDMTIFLAPGSLDVDLDLFVIDVINWSFFASSTSKELGGTENLQNLNFPAGIYLICVSQFGDQPQRDTAYALTVSPVVALDSDSDGVADWWEWSHFGTLERNGSLDWDNDQLNDKGEYLNSTDPKRPDTDGDGMPDGWEVEHRLDPISNDADKDPDRDGITNLREYQNGTDPNPSKPMPWIPLLLLDD